VTPRFARRRGEERPSGHVPPSASDDEQGGCQARNAASGSEQIQNCAMSERALGSRRVTTTADSRCARRRSAGGDGGTTLLRSVSSDEDGGTPANIAASGSSNHYSDVRAADLQEEMPEQRFS